MDPPEGVPVYFEEPQEQPMTNQRSSLLQLSFSRKSSKKLGSALQKARQAPASSRSNQHILLFHACVTSSPQYVYELGCESAMLSARTQQDVQKVSEFKTCQGEGSQLV